MPISIATDEALQMLAAGWTVRYMKATDDIEWRSPSGISRDTYRSESLDRPPLEAIETARIRGDIQDRLREAL